MEPILNYLRAHRRQHLAQLFELTRFPSVSTAPEHVEDVAQCARFLADHLQSLGMTRVEVMPTQRHPVVYAEWLEASDAPTILIYGHYDVQPPEPLELWDSSPFEPQIRQGEIYARGIADDKGQFFAYIKAMEAYFTEKGALPINVKLLLEGEEEIGSENLHAFVQAHRELLKADAIVLSDTSMFAPGLPTICYGTRGLVHCQIDLETAATDLHSGAFGGFAPNPIHILAEMITALKNKDGRITIPNFYEDVADLTPQEQAQFAALPYDEEALKREIGVTEFVGETGFSTLEKRWARPALDVNGILGGFTGDGTKTVIPAKAMAKFTLRLVPDQDPQKIFNATKAYLEQLAPAAAKICVTGDVGGSAYLTPLDHPIMPFIAKALQQAYHREPVFTRTGGTIGVLSTFSETLRLPIVMVGMAQPNDNAHAPNEHLTEELFYQGAEAAAYLLHELKTWNSA